MYPPEYRYAEVRADTDQNSRRIIGVAVQYGDISPGHRERFEPRAFGDVSSLDLLLTYQHNRERPLSRTGAGLDLRDSQNALEVSAKIAETREGDDALVLVRGGIAKGLSIEFRCKQATYTGGIRIIRRAVLLGLSLVDRPSYEASTVEARNQPPERRGRIWL